MKSLHTGLAWRDKPDNRCESPLQIIKCKLEGELLVARRDYQCSSDNNTILPPAAQTFLELHDFAKT